MGDLASGARMKVFQPEHGAGSEVARSRGKDDGTVPPGSGKISEGTPGLPPLILRCSDLTRISRGTRRAKEKHAGNMCNTAGNTPAEGGGG